MKGSVRAASIVVSSVWPAGTLIWVTRARRLDRDAVAGEYGQGLGFVRGTRIDNIKEDVMFRIDADGMVRNALVERRRFKSLERGEMALVNGIIVHQTGGATAGSTFNSYQSSSVGAHFLIDKDGKVFQTASLYQRTHHVGLLRSRCLERQLCEPTELKRLQAASLRQRSVLEQAKDFPARFPSNRDSIGIKLVGEYNRNPEFGKARGADEFLYVQVTDEQNAALRWLVIGLRRTLAVAAEDVHRHPSVSYKTSSEAASASW